MKLSDKKPRFSVNVPSIGEKWIPLYKRSFEQPVVFLRRINESQAKIYTLLLAGLIFILMLVYTIQHSHFPFLHDSLYYWQFADSFSNNGFSFTNFSNGLRGYFFPFLLFLIKAQAQLLGMDAKLLFYGYSALFFSVLSFYIIPWAFGAIFRWRTFLFGRLLIAFLIFFFWRGHFLYPLSDFPAFAFILIGVALLTQSLRSQDVSYLSIFIGFFIGAALNIRPVYLVSIFVILPFLLIHVYKLGLSKGAKWLSLILLGFSLILLPQFKINQTHFKVNSPWVLARVVDDENLYEKQLFWGLKTQKYEANMGDNYPSIVVIYNDPIAPKLQKAGLLRNKTFDGYIKIMQRYPLDMAVSLFRHMFNGLDIFFSTPYVRNIFADHTFFSAINYSVWFLVAIYFFQMDMSKLDHVKIVAVTGLLAPVVLAIPTAVEVRFFLPAYLLAYGVVAFDFDFVGSIKSLFRTPWNLLRLLVVSAFWIFLCFTLSNATIENLVR